MDEYQAMPPVYLTYMNRFDIEALMIGDKEILDAIERQLAIQGRGEAVIEPRMHLEPGVARGHFNVRAVHSATKWTPPASRSSPTSTTTISTTCPPSSPY